MAAVAAPSACTVQQKKQRQLAVTSYKSDAEGRAAYYRHIRARSPRQEQPARLKALRSLAACSKHAPPRTTTVPPRTTPTVPTTTTTSPSQLAVVSITMGAAGANRLTFTASSATPALRRQPRCVRAALPAGATFESVTASQGSCSAWRPHVRPRAAGSERRSHDHDRRPAARWDLDDTPTVEAKIPDPNAGNNSVAASFADAGARAALVVAVVQAGARAGERLLLVSPRPDRLLAVPEGGPDGQRPHAVRRLP